MTKCQTLNAETLLQAKVRSYLKDRFSDSAWIDIITKSDLPIQLDDGASG